jgi:transposase-like protein
MKNRKKGYTKELKEEAVNVALEANQSYKKTAKDLGVSSSALCAWIRQHRADQAACWTVPNKSIASMAKKRQFRLP